MPRRPQFVSLPVADQFDCIQAHGLPKSHIGKVIGIYPGGMLRVEFIVRGKPIYKNLLPKSIVRRS